LPARQVTGIFEELYNDPNSQSHQDEFKEGVSEILIHPDVIYFQKKISCITWSSAALAGTACSDYRDKGEIIHTTKS